MIMIKISFIFVSLVFYSMALAVPNGLHLAFKKSVIRAEGEQIKLSEILVIEPLGAQMHLTKDKISELEFTIKNRNLPSKEVIDFVVENTSLSRGDISWRGSQQVFFELKAGNAGFQNVADRIRNELTAHLKKHFVDASIEMTNSKNDQLKFGSAIEFRIKDIDRLKIRKRTAVWVEFMRDGKVISEQPFWFNAKVFNYGWVAINDIDKHQVINPSDFSMQLIDVTNGHNKFVKKYDELTGKWSTKKLLSGTLLKKQYIENEPLIKKHQDVTLIYKAEKISIESKAKALGSGSLGDSISILLEGGEKSVIAKIIARNRVQVEVSDA